MPPRILLFCVTPLENESLFRKAYSRIDPYRQKRVDRYAKEEDKRLALGAGLLLSYLRKEEGIEAPLVYNEHGKAYFEGNPLFNAGIGATVAADGSFELDAAIMEGKDLSAGAVAGVEHVKHPINAAYAVKTQSPHVMLSGAGAEEFAREQGLEMVDDNLYFATPKTMKWVEQFKAESKKNGTVGCVVLDKQGNLTAGTSTGGMLRKKWGRIGDSPVIGAGTYADNASCAVSCTGHGEYYIRHAVAFNVCARYKYLNESVEQATDYIIHQELNTDAGNGGLIAVDRKGNFAMPYNSQGMFRGFLYKEKGSSEVKKGCAIGQKIVTVGK